MRRLRNATNGPSGVVADSPHHSGTLQDDHPGAGKSDQHSITGLRARFRFHESFVALIRDPNTRRAYVRAVADFLAGSGDNQVPSLAAVQPLHVAARIPRPA
jgi:hypothetical protein